MLHYAGGNLHSFRFLTPYVSEYEVYSLELPGRGRRIREELLETSADAVADLVNQVNSIVGRGEYVIYGHSLGALLGYGVASEMISRGLPPKALIVSGNPGPQVREIKGIHGYSDEELKNYLVKLGGIEQEVIESKELMDFFLPIIRADFKLAEEFRESKYKPLEIPIHAIMGTEEEYVSDIENWKNYTRAGVKCDVLEGDHFFIHKNPEKISSIIKSYVVG